MCIVNPTLDKKDELVLINPQITKREGSEEGEEGCLSFPMIYGKICRAQRMTVTYQNMKFEPATLDCIDLLARIIQHELDHLDGRLLVDRMGSVAKLSHRKALANLEAEFAETR